MRRHRLACQLPECPDQRSPATATCCRVEHNRAALGSARPGTFLNDSGLAAVNRAMSYWTAVDQYHPDPGDRCRCSRRTYTDVARDARWSLAPRVYTHRNRVVRIDTTERQRAEEAVRASERRYRVLFQSTPIALVEHDVSALKARLDALQDSGVADIEAHLQEHPEAVATSGAGQGDRHEPGRNGAVRDGQPGCPQRLSICHRPRALHSVGAQHHA